MINQERLTKVILAPLVTEKAQVAGDKHRQIVFKVACDADKSEIKNAVEFLFKVKVRQVRVANMKGKTRTFGGRRGRRSDWKKAYVALEEGQDINFGTAE